MKKIILIFAILLLSISLVLANGNHQSEIAEGKKLVESKLDCGKLTDEQLEAIGEYYMEQMHPGESHDLMHKMMGIEEETEYHKQFHVNIARTIYCGDNNTGMMGSGMMGGNMMMPMMRMMMGGYGGMGNNFGYGMMGNPFGYSYWGFWNIIWLLFWIGLIVLLIWLIYKFIIKREETSRTPLEILKKRYAKEEITKKQFEQMKKDIGE